MLIANPIYDVVFKYLMDDNKVAKMLISSIIDMEVLDLDFQPQEFIADLSPSKSLAEMKKAKRKKKKVIPPEVYLTIYRLDFKARILTPEGEKLVIIEIQKAKYISEIMRFRRYLGEQYANENNVYESKTTKGLLVKKGMPIISIYFLGEKFENIANVPIVKVNNQAIDLFSGEELALKEDFIEALTHKCFIVCIPNLKKRRRTELEMLLSIFDQSNRSAHHHILNISEHDFPEKFREIIRRLQKAQSEQTLRNQMTLEDNLRSQIENVWRESPEDKEKIAKQEKIIEEKEKALSKSKLVVKESKKAVKESKKAIEQIGKTVAEKEKTIEEKEKTIEEKEKTIEKIGKTVAEKEKTIEEKEKILKDKENELVKKDKTLEDQQAMIQRLKDELDKMKQK